MPTEIDHRVSPSLHAENVTQIEGYDDPDIATVLAPTLTAFDEAYQGVSQVFAAREKAKTNPTWNEAQQIIATDDLAQKQLVRITRVMDTTRANLEKGIAHIETELSQPVTARAAHPVAGEIRSYVRGLGTAKLHDFIKDAILSGDHETVSSVLGGPAYLSGLTPEFQKTYLRLYHEHHNPATAKRLRAMQAAKSLIEERGALVFKELEKAVGAPPHKAKALRQAKTAAEKAFVLRDA